MRVINMIITITILNTNNENRRIRSEEKKSHTTCLF